MSKSKNETCLDKQFLQEYLQEQLPESEESKVLGHLEHCSDCQRQLEQAAADQHLWNSLGEHMTYARETRRDSNVKDDRLARLIEYLAPTDDPQMLGRLGTYEICGLVGQGSTGIVLKAFESQLNRFVAIKVLSPVFSSNGAARRRFEREGRAVAAVLHQNVVPIYAVDEFRGLPYIVMQYIPGVSLLHRIEKDGALDTCEVTRIGLQVAQGLSAAHAQGIVHRDVKPANVILKNTVDRAVVTDFGLARVADEATMTRSGTIAGTPQYMAPEQAKGEATDPRSDLFSLGSLMYAACTARPPFRAETVYGVMHRVCQSDPRPIREINPQIEQWLVDFIGRLMAKRQADRFQSADEVAENLSAELAYLQNPTAVEMPTREWIKPVVETKTDVSATKPLKAVSKSYRTGWALASIGIMALAAIVFLPGNPVQQSMLAMFDTVPETVLEPNKNEAVQSEADFKEKAMTPSANSLVPAVFFDEAKITWTESQDGNLTDKPKFTQKLEQMFSVEKGGKLSVDVDRGEVVIFPSELEDRVSVTVLRKVSAGSQEEAEEMISKHELTLTQVDDELLIRGRVDAELSDRDPYDAFQRMVFRISVPKNFSPTVESGAGSVSVGSLTGDVSVVAHKGNVEVGQVDGDVFVEATGGNASVTKGCTGRAELLCINGDVYLANASGTARVRTSGGDVWLGRNTADVTTQTGGGHVKVNELAGKMSVHAQGGDVVVRVPETPPKNCRFSSSSGSVELKLASDVAAEIQARGELAAGNLEFEEIDAEDEDASQEPWMARSFNEGGARIQAISSNAQILVSQFEPTESDEDEYGLGGSGLGGSGLSGRSRELSDYARAKTSGDPRPGALVTVELDAESDMDGYTLYLPESHAEHKGTYPILVYLQGAFGVGGEISGVNNWGMLRLIRDGRDLSIERNQMLLDSFIVISPHIQRGEYHDHAKLVKQIIEDVAKEFKGDLDRVSVTGLSRGGHGSWGLPSRLPNMFAAIAPIGGSPESVTDFKNVTNASIWVAHNTGDPNLPFSDVADAIEEMEQQEDVEFLRIDKADASETDYLNRRFILTAPKNDNHDAWTDMYMSVEFYKWLLKQKRAS